MDINEFLSRCRLCQSRIESSFPRITFKSIRDLFNLERCWKEDECIEASKMVVGRHWRELAADKIAVIGHVLPLLANDAKIALLPAFLWWSLDYRSDHENKYQHDIAWHAIDFVCPTTLNGELSRRRLLEYSDGLSDAQKVAVLEWIDVLLLAEFRPAVRLLEPLNEVRKLLSGNAGASNSGS
jgi:hypothetical protein